jgi:hypothetical protein
MGVTGADTGLAAAHPKKPAHVSVIVSAAIIAPSRLLAGVRAINTVGPMLRAIEFFGTPKAEPHIHSTLLVGLGIWTAGGILWFFIASMPCVTADAATTPICHGPGMNLAIDTPTERAINPPCATACQNLLT